MTDIASHISDLQAILDAANAAARANPTSANISAVEKARKALESCQSRSENGERFKTQAAALEYLQRTYRIEKSKLSKDVNDGRVPRKDGYFHSRDLDYYARADRLDPKTSEAPKSDDSADEIKRETARKLRLANEEREGMLINKAEEEARDAKLWAAIKSDIENHGHALVHELINRVLPIIPDDDLKAKVLAINHALKLTYEDAVADIFDRYARDGGIEV